MKSIPRIPLLLIFCSIILNYSFALDAPITSAGSANICSGNTFKVPITVVGFNDITAVSLRLDYNPTQVSYSNATGINSSLPGGVIVNKIVVNSTLHKIMIIWSDVNPVTLSTGSKLLDLNFTYLAGTPVLTFNNTSNSGNDCEYADAVGDPMNDSPTNTFYFNSTVSYMVLGTVGAISGPTSVFPQSIETYSTPPITNATSYNWTLPDGSSGSSTTNTISVTFTSNSFSSPIAVNGENACGVTTTASLYVTVNKVLKLKFFLEGLYNPISLHLNKAKDQYGYRFGSDTADIYTIELHSNTHPYQTIYSATNINLNTDGTSQMSIPNNLNGSYYIVINHRNHINIWASQTVSFQNNLIEYDFTDNAFKAFGNNLKQAGIHYLIPCGDINQDNIVDALDMIAIDNMAAVQEPGYLPEDQNGDGQINLTDILLVENNSTSFVATNQPVL